uniref:RBR-type E3 ubiquitin transferase n=1 Tax=Strongyloides venezuelensis TaxID=75913 RepID=A0A0K0FAI0_STRVS
MDDSFNSYTSESSNSSGDEIYIPNQISKCFFKGMFSDADGIKVLSDKEIYHKWKSICDIINLMVPISTKSMLHLLKIYKWNIEEIQKEIYNYTPDIFIEKVNINIEEAFGESNLIRTNIKDECNICFFNDYLYKLSCNHTCCLGCWKNYIANKVIDNNDLYFYCIDTECNLMINYSDVVNLIITEDCEESLMNARNTFIRNIARKYADEADNVIRCPNVSCNNNIIYEKHIITGIECQCGGLYCKNCNENFHYPLNCEMIRKFINFHVDTNKDELETIQFIISKTRPCPSCKCDIEKYEGCNHMTCKKCKYEFCWQCLGNWQGYNVNHDCDITKSEIFKERRSKLEEAQKNEMLNEKYAKYFAKYHDNKVNMNYDDSLKIVIKKVIESSNNFNEKEDLEKKIYKLHRLLIFYRRLAMNIAIFLFFCDDPSLNMTLLECKISISDGFASTISNFLTYELIRTDEENISKEIVNKTITLFRAISNVFDECENCFKNNYVRFLSI